MHHRRRHRRRRRRVPLCCAVHPPVRPACGEALCPSITTGRADARAYTHRQETTSRSPGCFFLCLNFSPFLSGH
jgi:hypothetical protein